MGAWRGIFVGLILGLSLVLTGAGVGSAQAQALGRVISPILTIDRDRLFTGSQFGQRVNRELEAARNAMAAETRKIETALEEEERSLTERRATLTAEEFRSLANAFDEKVQALREERDVAESNLRRQIEEAQLQFFDRIGPILGAMVRERGAVMILDRRAILLSAADVDITDAAIARIDALLGDGAGVVEEEGAGQDSPPVEQMPVDTIPAPESADPTAQ